MKIRAADQAAIDAFIAKRGVTKCPPAAAAPIAGGVTPQAALTEHGDQQAEKRKAQLRRNDHLMPKRAAKAVPLVSSRAAAPKREIGPKPTMAWLPLASLHVDDTYQRRMNAGHVRKLAAEFTWAAFKPLTVVELGAERGYAVIDGQHEAEAARRVGLVEVPCFIVTATDKRAAAGAFVALNRNRKAVTGVDLYIAALAAGEAWALQIERLLEETGVAICRTGAPKAMETKSISSLRVLCARVGGAAVKRALGLIARSWPDEAKAFRERPLLCLSRLVAQSPALTDAEIAAWCKARNSYQFERAVWDAAEKWICEPAAALERLVKGEKPK